MRVRLLRVLEYEGTPEQIADAINKRGVKGTYEVTGGGNKGLVIREAIIGETATILQEELTTGDSGES